MKPNVQTQAPSPAYREPPAADYSDEVTEAHISALAEALQAEFEGEDLIVISGPEW